MQDRRDARCGSGKIRAHAGIGRRLNAQNLAVLGGSQLNILDVVASVSCALKVFPAAFGPLHRPVEFLCAEDGDEVCRIRGNLAAEPTSNFGRDHTKLVLGNTRHHGAEKPCNVWVLGCVPERQFAGCPRPVGQRRTRFHRIRDQALLDDTLLNNDVRFLESPIDITARNRPVERHIVLNIRMDLRCSRLFGFFRIDDCRERFVVYDNQVERIRRLIWTFGHDGGNDVANVADQIFCDTWIPRDLQIRVGNQPGAGHRIQCAFNIRGGKHGDDTRSRLRARCVDAFDSSVCMRTAQQDHVHHIGKRVIVGVRRRPRNEPGILAPPDSGAKYSSAHPFLLIAAAASRTARIMF